MNTTSRPSLVPVIAGISLAAVFMLGLGLWVAYREPSQPTVPTVTLLSPAADTTVAGPVVITFETHPAIKLQPTGWGIGRYHLHAMIGSVEHMPGPTDIRAVGAHRFEWRLPQPAERAPLQLVWSLPNHTRLPENASRTIQIAPLEP